MIYAILLINLLLLCFIIWFIHIRFLSRMDALSELLSKTSSRLDNLEQSYQSIAAGQYMLLMSDIENEINNCDASIPRDEKEYVQSILKKIDQNHQKIIDTQKKIFPGDDNPTLPWLKKSSH